ncbi:bah-phd domain-containing protein [Stylonychia lemnae]|uniref:Bah-phd domain-containing protein n=1 Tax=Stylonychia lemnae TaxID=5949 RepID=A0A077ZRA3_STYLE|nr:bah-phd domain-containing protein [Stylonychia lemnae]|eukprot:CDW71979.1 bah-phd domain-containing protein [Stylonychia lemnae]
MLGLTSQQFAAISDQEVFPTNHYDQVYVQTINGKCTILTLGDYEKRPLVNEETYFTRASYNRNTKTFKPYFDDWDYQCSCKMPTNPDQTYIECEACLEWYHPECQSTTVDIENFICKACEECQ